MARSITLVPDSSNRMTSPAGSGFKTEEDYLKILIVDSSVYNTARKLLLQ